MTNKHDERVEAAAEAIYNAMPYDEPGEKPVWVPGGNSLKQDEARKYARVALTTLTREVREQTLAEVREGLEDDIRLYGCYEGCNCRRRLLDTLENK